MVKTHFEKEQILRLLDTIPDPEIPAININELGVVREVLIQDDAVTVVITPTYSGCPAMRMIEDDIVRVLKENGVTNLSVKTVYAPAWTTEWISDEAKEKMRKSGIAPPEKSGKPKEVKCPQCGSADVTLTSQFGSTACKALYKCNSCLEPFDYFKCI